jgi:hypothetical protein
MNTKLFCKLTVLIFFLVTLCGCFNQTTPKNKFEGIQIESSVVELAAASLDKQDLMWRYPDEGDPYQVPRKIAVHYLLRNIVDRTINVAVTLQFLDKNNSIVATVEGTPIYNFFEGKTEEMKNTVYYNKVGVEDVTHVKIIAVEI